MSGCLGLGEGVLDKGMMVMVWDLEGRGYWVEWVFLEGLVFAHWRGPWTLEEGW